MQRQIETSISKDNLKAAISEFLTTRKLMLINKDEFIGNISFETKMLKSDDPEVIPLEITIEREEEVQTYKHHGKNGS
jgi:hypothetical protein